MKIGTLHGRVYSLEKLMTFRTTPNKLKSLFIKAFKCEPLIRFEMESFSWKPTKYYEVSVGGMFEVNDSDQPVIRIFLNMPKVTFDETILILSSQRRELLFQVFLTLAHEYVHFAQYKKQRGCPRPYSDPNPRRAYYGQVTEIDAHALTAALEDHYGSGAPSTTHKLYRGVFKPDDPLYKRFLKKKAKYSLTLPGVCDINRLLPGGTYGTERGPRRI